MVRRFAVIKIIRTITPYINSHRIVDEKEGVRGEIIDSFENIEEAFALANKQKDKVYIHDYEEHKDYTEKEWRKNDDT